MGNGLITIRLAGDGTGLEEGVGGNTSGRLFKFEIMSESWTRLSFIPIYKKNKLRESIQAFFFKILYVVLTPSAHQKRNETLLRILSVPHSHSPFLANLF